MIKIDYVDTNGQIHFYSTENVKCVKVKICDKEHEHCAYSTQIDEMPMNVAELI